MATKDMLDDLDPEEAAPMTADNKEPQNGNVASDDFTLLLAEVRAASQGVASSQLSGWIERFGILWKRDSDQWDKLFELLPLAEDTNTTTPRRLKNT